MAIAIAAFTLQSCEDVPFPYDIPGITGGGGDDDPTVAPTGTGTVDDPYNVAGALAFIKTLDADVESEKEIYIKGKVKIISTDEATIKQYGNHTFTMVDEGSETIFTAFQVYGPGKKKFTSMDQLKEGDEVVVCGKVVNYKGNTPETVGKGAAYVYSINGEGGVPPGKEGTPAGAGTKADPYNVAGALAFIKTLGADTESATEVYVKGKVSANNTTDATISSYGNMTFTMIDEGCEGDFTAFQVYGPGKKKFTSVGQIKEGDEVIVCGKVVNYKGNTPETVGKGAAYVYSINGKAEEAGGDDQPVTGDVKGSGTEADPYNVAGIIKYTSGLAADKNSDKEVYFTGTVDSFKSGEEPGNSYGNATFYIKDESTTDKFYCFRVMGPNNEKFTSADQLKIGQKVTVKGLVVNYKGNTPETVSGKAYIVKIDGEGTGGGEQGGSDPVTPGAGDVNLVMANVYSECTDGSVDAGTKTVGGITLAFAQNDGSNAPKYYWNKTPEFCSVRMYAKNSVEVKADKTISKVVFTCAAGSGSTNYNGNPTMTTSKGSISKASDNVTVTVSNINSSSFTLTNEHTATSSGVQFRIVKMEIYYASSAKRNIVRRR